MKMAKSRKHLYEGMYILSATLSEEARKKAVEKICASITDEKGEVHKIFEQGRHKLAYEIDKRREGYYYVIYFSAQSNGIAQKWRDYHLNEDLIRFTTLRASHVPENLEFKQLVRE
jgi:small subunit ribosomal protein S6